MLVTGKPGLGQGITRRRITAPAQADGGARILQAGKGYAALGGNPVTLRTSRAVLDPLRVG